MAGSEAQAGFYYQNIIAAQYALDLIEFGSQLHSITLENPQRAKYIDDIIVDKADSTSFIQVKWSEDDTSAFTLYNLINVDDNSAPLFEKLARGFRQVSTEAERIEIILLSTKRAGASRQRSKGFDKSLSEFLKEFHEPFISDSELIDIRQVPTFARYEAILERLRSSSGFLDFEQLSPFLKCLRFELNQPGRKSMAERVRAQLSRLGIDQSHYSGLLDQIVRWSIEGNPVHREDVLHILGLLDHFADRLGHNFPVDKQAWVPTPEVFKTLDSSIQALDSGFILLEGEPGSGKSTALTMYHTQRTEVRFGYYCFVPNDRTLGNDRLEDDSFIRSICIGLRNAFPDVEFPSPYAPYTQKLMNRWLHTLSSQGRRVVFIVDGLDHVDRKTSQSLVARPLTAALDGELPLNVLIILGSQYMNALPPRLRQHILSDTRRHIRMPRFGRDQVHEFLRLRDVNVAEEDLDAAVETSGGVPIYLEYLAQRLSGMDRNSQRRFLAEVPSLRNQKIDHYHQYLWDSFMDSQELIYILAILAAREEFISHDHLLNILRLVKVNANLASVYEAVEKVQHLLRISDAQSVAIRHNSFREFVSERTAYLASEVNRALASWYEQNPDQDEAWRNRFRHLYQLGEYKAILAACDDEWLERSWTSHRPVHEIQINLDIVWRATVAQQDLLEFIRIAFIKHRVALVARNLDLSEAEIGRLLVDMGNPDKALRRVWDGDRSRCTAIEFAEFCLHHVRNVGRLPPRRVLESGLGSAPGPSSPEDRKTWYKARAYLVDPVELASEIADIRWTKKKEYGYLKEPLDDDGNKRLNLEIQMGLVQELAEWGNLDRLRRLQAEESIPHPVRAAARAASGLVLAQGGERREASSVLEGLDLSPIPPGTQRWLLINLAECGNEDLCGVAGSKYPELPDQFLSPGERELSVDLFSLYDRLRLFFLSNETGHPWLEARTTNLDEPLRTLVRATGRIAQAWCSCIRGVSNGTLLLSCLKEVAAALDLDRRLFESLDYHKDYAQQLYLQEAHHFYGALWSCAAEFLPNQELGELTEWWARSQVGRLAASYPKATLELATVSGNRSGGDLDGVVRNLLTLAESNARADEETSVMVDGLVACASAWALSSFSEEAQRIWDELLDLGCGIYWRKDYQFNEILLPLKLAHGQDPNSTVGRLQEQFKLAHRLIETAQSKTTAIAIEGLIEFTAIVSPGLALKLVEHEDFWISRERALHRIILKLVGLDGIDFRLLLALVGTMERYGNHTEYDEYTRPAMFALYSAALEQRNKESARAVYDWARYVLLVEKGCPSDVAVWAEEWIALGDAPADVLADLEKYKSEDVPSTEPTQNSYLVEDNLPTELLDELDSIAYRDLRELQERLNHISEEGIDRERRRNLERTFDDFRQAVGTAMGKKFIEGDDQAFSACFDEFVNEACSSQHESGTDTLEALQRFLVRIAERLGIDLAIDRFRHFFDVDDWLDGFLHVGSARYFNDQVIEKRLQTWIEAASHTNLQGWEDFSRQQYRGETKALGLLAVGRRIASTNPGRAMNVLEEAWKSCSEFFYSHTQLAHNILYEAMRLDRKKGRDLLLESFRQEYSRYPESMIYRLDRVLEFAGEFPGFDAVQLYDIWAGHNRRLAAGLSEKPVEMDWLVSQKEEEFSKACFQYLLGLFDYPVVDVRRMALAEVYRLVSERFDLIEGILDCWPDLSNGQKEHVSVLLFSLGMEYPDFASEWSTRLVKLGQKEPHYNLRATIAEAVLAAIDRGALIDPELSAGARALKDRPRLIVAPPPSLHAESKTRAQYPPYLRWSLDLLETAIISNEDLDARVQIILARLYRQPDHGLVKEVAAHRHYNINTNFDAIEISGDYERAVREAINLALYQLIQEHAIDGEALDQTVDVLRLYDPTDLQVPRRTRPAGVNWINRDLSDQEFVAYADNNNLKKSFLQRDGNWVTLYEQTEQRIGGWYGSEPERATKVGITVFGVPLGSKAPTLPEIENEVREGLLAPLRNRYRFEMQIVDPVSLAPSEEISGRLVPIVRVSRNAFRGRPGTDIAALVPGLARELEGERDDENLFGYTVHGKQVVRSIEWQEAFDQGRRLHEPRSSGFLLQMNRNLLSGWARSRGVELWGYMVMNRTTDRYKPEAEMDWKGYSELFPLAPL